MRLAWILLVVALGCGRDHGRAPDDATTARGSDRADDAKRRAWRRSVIDPAPGATTCARFAGRPLTASWDDCIDHVHRELACAKDARGEIECLCVEDGVEKWRFTARDPRLDEQVEATRVARSNCHMSFQGF